MKTTPFPAIPAPPEALAKAATHLQDGQLEPANAMLQALLSTHPTDAAVHRLLGLLSAQAGDFPAAIARLTGACRLAPGSAQMPLELGRMHAATGDFNNALPCFEKASLLNPGLDRCPARAGRCPTPWQPLPPGAGATDAALAGRLQTPSH